jgi:hypothetical protein
MRTTKDLLKLARDSLLQYQRESIQKADLTGAMMPNEMQYLCNQAETDLLSFCDWYLGKTEEFPKRFELDRHALLFSLHYHTECDEEFKESIFNDYAKALMFALKWIGFSKTGGKELTTPTTSTT